jgi:hypothetical protein
MPFQSQSQLRACYARKAQLEKLGKVSSWNCSKWYAERTKPFKELPNYKYEDNTIYIGPRGGHYIVVKSKKVYQKISHKGSMKKKRNAK